MKACLLVPVLLVFAMVGIHVEQQLDRYQAGVGEDVLVMLSLTNTGESELEVSVVPGPAREGLVVLNPGIQSMNIMPGSSAAVNYPVMGERPGLYAVASQVTYTDIEGRSRQIVCGDRMGRQLNVS